MIFKHDLVEQIRFEYCKGTNSDDFANNYDVITGKPLVYDEKKEDLVPVGEIYVYFFNIEGSDASASQVLDSIDSDTAGLIKYFDYDFNVVNNKVSCLFDLDDEIMDMNKNFIYLHMLTVDKKFRGKGIGKLLIQATLNDIKRDASFAFLNAVPLQFRDEDKKSKAKSSKEFKNRTKEQSKKKLIQLYESCGFKSINKDGTDMVACISELYL
jgi:GNAT superfamily N-acetyltransferase